MMMRGASSKSEHDALRHIPFRHVVGGFDCEGRKRGGKKDVLVVISSFQEQCRWIVIFTGG